MGMLLPYQRMSTHPVAMVTGASRGIGRAIATELARHGHAVVVNYRSNADAAAEVVAEINAAGAEGIAVAADVACASARDQLVDAVLERFGRLDVLVNNAGIAPIGTIESTSTAQWRAVLNVHLDGTFFGCRAALPLMIASGGGSIINMSSTAALVGISPYLAYSAAKGGIRSMTKSIAVHCREQRNGVRCNSIHPGSIDTPMVHHALEQLAGLDLPGAADPEATRRALGIGEPNDVANLVLFLASDEAKHLNGAELVVDNGDTLAQAPPPGGAS